MDINLSIIVQFLSRFSLQFSRQWNTSFSRLARLVNHAPLTVSTPTIIRNLLSWNFNMLEEIGSTSFPNIVSCVTLMWKSNRSCRLESDQILEIRLNYTIRLIQLNLGRICTSKWTKIKRQVASKRKLYRCDISKYYRLFLNKRSKYYGNLLFRRNFENYLICPVYSEIRNVEFYFYENFV